MTDDVVKFDLEFKSHCVPERTYGDPCPKCGQALCRTYYRDAEVMGQRKTILIQSCGCVGDRP